LQLFGVDQAMTRGTREQRRSDVDAALGTTEGSLPRVGSLDHRPGLGRRAPRGADLVGSGDTDRDPPVQLPGLVQRESRYEQVQGDANEDHDGCDVHNRDETSTNTTH